MTKVINNMDLTSCPLCRDTKSRFLFSTRTEFMEFRIIRCRQCGLAWNSPFPRHDILSIHDTRSYYGSCANKFIPWVQKIRNRIMELRSRYYLSLISDSVKKPKILDIGCAEGRLLKSFLEHDCQCWGIEQPDFPAERFINSDQISYFQGNLEDIGLVEQSFDLIFIWHVLEHMDNPDTVIKILYSLLAPEGSLILAVPNFSSVEAKAFKQFWFHLDIPWHKYHFNESSLRYLAEKNKLRIIKYGNLCLEQGPYGLLQSILNALRLPFNGLYEAIKGNSLHRRSFILFPQILFAIFIFIPVFLVSIAMSMMKKGAVIKLILKKNNLQ